MAMGNLEFLVSPASSSNILRSPVEFNTIYQGVVLASNIAIIKRTCESTNAYCQIAEIFYKRFEPEDGFQPYSKLLTAWEEGTDNRFNQDFELYS